MVRNRADQGGRRGGGRRYVVVALILVVGGAAILMERIGLLDPVKRPVARWVHHHERPKLAWLESDPAATGSDPHVLEEMRRDLERWNTLAFLVAREGRIIYEWYAPVAGPNAPLQLAAANKGLTGFLALALALTDSAVRLDEPVYEHAPEWRDDPGRREILFRHLAFHTSGLDDVDFDAGSRGDLTGWKRRYYDMPLQRFDMALRDAPLLFEPGTHFEYSGLGYYALANALTAALRDRGHPDLRALLRDRVMRPLGIPDDAWEISYGESTESAGRELYAIGSGAAYTPRAAARIAELLRTHGRWNGHQLVDSAAVAALLDPEFAPRRAEPAAATNLPPETVAAAGWFLNRRGAWPSLPRDAFVALGGRHQVILVVPSWDLLAVRLGFGILGGEDPQFGESLEEHFFRPLARAVGASPDSTGPG